MILQSLTVGPFQENCYIIGDPATREGAVIDPGDEAPRIIKAMENTGLRFKYIINTHAHIDHVGAVQSVKDHFAIPFYLHRDDEVILRHMPQSAAMFGLKVGRVPDIDFYFNPPADMRLGDLSFKIFHAPGHSPGSVCFYFAAQHILIAGDVLFNGSIGRTDLPGGDFDTLINSIRQNIFTLPEETTVYPGHGPETTVGFEKKFNPFFDHNGLMA